MSSFIRAPGVRVRALGEGWVAFSALSGETHLLNAESVAVLEALQVDVATDEATVVQRLAEEYGVPPQELADTLAVAWPQLQEAGLVREQASAPAP